MIVTKNHIKIKTDVILNRFEFNIKKLLFLVKNLEIQVIITMITRICNY